MSEDEGSDINIRSPLDEMLSPVSLDSQTKVRAAVCAGLLTRPQLALTARSLPA